MFFKRYHFSIINFDLSCIFVFLTYSVRLSWVNMSFIGIATAPRNIFSNRRSQAQMVAFSVFPKTASIGIWYVTCQKIVLIRLWFFLHESCEMLRLLAHTIILPQTVKMYYLSVVIRWKLVKGYQLSTFMLDVTPITCLSTPWWVSLSEKNVSSGIVTAPRNIFSHTVPQSQSVAWSVLHFTTSIGILYSSWKIKVSSFCLIISSNRLFIKKYFVVCVFIYTDHFHKRRMTIFANYFCLALCCLRWIRM